MTYIDINDAAPQRKGGNPGIMTWTCGAIAACLGLIAAACASYKGQPLPPASSLRFGTTMELVSIHVEPLSRAEVKTVFDTNPDELRILFLRAILQNEGGAPYVVSRSRLRLLMKQGIALTPVSPSRVARKMRSTHDGLAVGSVFLFGPLSYPSFQSANEASDSMVKDLTDKALPERAELGPHTTVSGVLYFELPSYVTSGDCVRIDVLLDPDQGGDPLQIRVPLLPGSQEDGR